MARFRPRPNHLALQTDPEKAAPFAAWKPLRKYKVRGKTEAEAYEKLGELKAALRRGEKSINENSTATKWYEEWKKLYKENSGITAKSLAMYDQKFYNYIGPTIGSMQVKDIGDIHLQRILNNQAGMSFSHVSKLRMLMRELFSKARRSRLILFDPSEGLVLPANKKGNHRAITETERGSTSSALLKQHPAGLWVLRMLYAGLRPGETAALQWKDVDFNANELRLYKAIESGTNDIKGPKTASGVRNIPMHQTLRNKLLPSKNDLFSPVFPNRSGSFQDSDTMGRRWRSFKRALDIAMGAKVYRNQIIQHAVADDLIPYCLRHTFCTDLEAAGVPINVAKVLMGHSDISITANIYTHTNQGVLHGGIAKLDGTQKGDDISSGPFASKL